LVEERQHVVLGFVFGVTEGLAEALDQVFLFLAGEGPIQITCLLEVLFLVNLALLGGASQRQLAVAGSFGLRLGRHAAWLVVHLAGTGTGVRRAILVVVIHRRLGLVDRQELVVRAQAIHLGEIGRASCRERG